MAISTRACSAFAQREHTPPKVPAELPFPASSGSHTATSGQYAFPGIYFIIPGIYFILLSAQLIASISFQPCFPILRLFSFHSLVKTGLFPKHRAAFSSVATGIHMFLWLWQFLVCRQSDIHQLCHMEMLLNKSNTQHYTSKIKEINFNVWQIKLLINTAVWFVLEGCLAPGIWVSIQC